ESIHFILTSHNPDKLLPTIRSRTQMFAVPRINTLESRRLLAENKDIDDITMQRLLFIADGLPAQLSRLRNGGNDFKKLSELVLSARQVVEGSLYHRLAFVKAYGGDRQDTTILIDMIMLFLRRSLTSNPNQSTVRLMNRMIDASQAIRANGSIKLHLAVAMV